MAQIYNSDLTKELVKGASIQQSKDQVPNQLAEKVVPVMEVNPRLLRSVNVIRHVAVAGTMYTTPTDRDFYLTYANVSTSIASANNFYGTITITPKGGAAVIVLSAVGCATALVTGASSTATANFDTPILLERGSTISFAVSNADVKHAQIGGYIVDTSNS